MKILITGGAGFIGSHFVKTVLERKKPYEHVLVIDSLTYAGNIKNLDFAQNNSNFEFIRSDINDIFSLSIKIGQIDTIVNFAAESHVDRSIESSSAFIMSNVLGTNTLLEFALQKKVRKFIQISTDEVYGSIKLGSWDEKFPLNPNSPYSASKAAADLIALSYHKTHGLDVSITRSSNNYGPNQFPEKIIPLFVSNLLRGKKIPLYGTGENIRDWIYVQDNCDAIYKVLTDGKPGEIYNIGGGNEITNKQLTYKVLEKMNLDESFIESVPDRKGHDLRYSVNCSKINNALGWSPKVDFELGLENTINWYRDNLDFWQ